MCKGVIIRERKGGKRGERRKRRQCVSETKKENERRGEATDEMRVKGNMKRFVEGVSNEKK